MLEINLFGPGESSYRGEPLPGFPNQRPGQLLCYLLLNRGVPLHRESLATVFWEQYPTATSRKYLRDALWRLRRSLRSVGAPVDQFLAVDDESIAFIGDGDCRLDVQTFEQAAEQSVNLDGEQLKPELAEAIARAVELYRGDLLEGCFEDWVLNDRERLRLRFLRMLNQLMELHHSRGELDSAIHYGNRVLEHDPTRESVSRQLIRLRWAQGQRKAALRRYGDLKRALDEHLGVRPSKKTRRLFHKIRAGKPYQAGSPKSAVGTPSEKEDAPVHTAEQAIEKLHRLQRMLDRTNRELQGLERTFRLVLTKAQEQ